jgi:hypothetical protein
MVLDGVMFHRGTTLKSFHPLLKLIFPKAIGRLRVKFLMHARKLCKEGKSIDGRAFRSEAGSLFHILINTCVQNLMTAKYLWRLSEVIVQ